MPLPDPTAVMGHGPTPSPGVPPHLLGVDPIQGFHLLRRCRRFGFVVPISLWEHPMDRDSVLGFEGFGVPISLGEQPMDRGCPVRLGFGGFGVWGIWGPHTPVGRFHGQRLLHGAGPQGLGDLGCLFGVPRGIWGVSLAFLGCHLGCQFGGFGGFGCSLGFWGAFWDLESVPTPQMWVRAPS